MALARTPSLPAGHAGQSLRLITGATLLTKPALPLGSVDPMAAPTSDTLDLDFSRTLAAVRGAAGRARIHALHPARPGDEGAATGFAFELLRHFAAVACGYSSQAQIRAQHARPTLRPILWVQDRGGRREAGQPYGPGLAALGVDPAQLIIVSTKTALDALAAAEIGLEMGGLGGVLAELPRQLPNDMLALGKRLALRAERSTTPCLLLHASATPVQAPVATRWLIASRAAVSHGAWDAPLPTVALTLIKNRFGPTGCWSAQLMGACRGPAASSGVCHVNAAHVSTPLSQPVAAVSVHRPGSEAEGASEQPSDRCHAA